jgi:hypothetical protein
MADPSACGSPPSSAGSWLRTTRLRSHLPLTVVCDITWAPGFFWHGRQRRVYIAARRADHETRFVLPSGQAVSASLDPQRIRWVEPRRAP